MSARNRNSIIARIRKTTAALGTLGKRTVALQWTLAEDLVALQGTYPQGKAGRAAFLATAATETGRSEASVGNLVRAVEVRESLSPKQRERIEGWAYDMVLALAKGSSAQRNTVIGRVEKSGTRNTVEIRGIAAKVYGTKPRNRKSNADATIAMATKVQDAVEKLLGHGHDPLTLIAGIELAREFPSGPLADAVRFIVTNRAKDRAKVAS